MSNPIDPEQRLQSIIRAHSLAGYFTLYTGLGCWLLSRNLWTSLVSDKVARAQEQTIYVITIFIGVYAFLCLLHGVLMVLNGRWIGRRDRFERVYLVAAINAIIAPVGTALFAFTALNLSRPEVRSLFSDARPTRQP